MNECSERIIEGRKKGRKEGREGKRKGGRERERKEGRRRKDFIKQDLVLGFNSKITAL